MKFLMVSKNEKDIEFAMKYNIWQTKNTFHHIKEGDVGYIKLIEEKEIYYLGIVESLKIEPQLKWPGWNAEAGEKFTIRFRQVLDNDFSKSQQAIRYEK